MRHGVDSLTGIRPTADLTVANYIGAVKPILEGEDRDESSVVFLAELHAATTSPPREVLGHSGELARTLIAAGVQSEIYSQREFEVEVATVEYAIRGLTTAARLLRLPTLKEKVMQSDQPENANMGLVMYPILMASDIILARPQHVPTGKDQRPHLEITNELIRAFNREYDAALPEPLPRAQEAMHILSLDGSGRKMSKSIPGGAVFLDDAPTVGHRKIMKAQTASEPGEAMDRSVDNLLVIAENLVDPDRATEIVSLQALAARTKQGERVAGEFKSHVGDIVADFLSKINAARAQVDDQEVAARIASGNKWFRPVAEDTARYVRQQQWGE